MSQTTTIGIFSSRSDTESAIKEFRSGGMSDGEISTVYGDSVEELRYTHSIAKVGMGTATGAVTGAVVGAIAGLVVANGVLPGIGTLFVAGPLATALGMTGAVAAGTTTGVIAGGIAGALVEYGVIKEDAAIYEHHVKQGNYVAITRSPLSIAKQIFSKFNATEIREYVTA